MCVAMSWWRASFLATRLTTQRQIVLSDAVVTWRAYLVWNKDWKVVAFPILTMCGTGGTRPILANYLRRTTRLTLDL